MQQKQLIPCYCCGEAFPPSTAHEHATNFVALYEAEGDVSGECMAIVICRDCMERGDFDMWTDEREWDSKNPVVPYRYLPTLDRQDPSWEDESKYPSPKELLSAERDTK